MVLKKVIQIGNSRAVTVPKHFELGEYVDVKVYKIKIQRKEVKN